MMIIQDEFSTEHLFYISKDLGLKWDLISFEFSSIEAYTMLRRDNSIIFSGFNISNDNYGTFISNDKLASFPKFLQKCLIESLKIVMRICMHFRNNVPCGIIQG